jgi:two-component system nitrogen regulation sensor histidine kinase NtrY
MFKLTLRSRLYFSMLALIVISFVVTGITAFYNFKAQNEEYHSKRFNRKEDAVKASMNYFLETQGGYIAPDSVTIVFSDKICELSDVHNMDIRLFDLKGNQLISAIPNHGSDELANPDAIDYAIFKKLSSGSQRAETQREYNGQPFILAYWYFVDLDDRPIAITNVRYDKQDANREDLNKFLIRLTAIYIPLFFGASILAFFLSNYITKSLQRIGALMKDVSVGKNEPIVWDSTDEIGTLVAEYNRMLSEVEKSADALAKSERESAWREMAKQVAHEIKNPLTPMKLRIQHLQRAWDDGAKDFDKRIKDTSHSLVEQIDTLTNIANEFSNFAQMPKAKREMCDFAQIVSASTELFSDTSNVKFRFENQVSGSAEIYADKDQVIRVLNNLITNAFQAIPADGKGAVIARLSELDSKFLCEIKDDGQGIEESQKGQIFVPNFTTKSTGMGLGLAMVKNIVESHNGEVWFETQIGLGSSFFVSFPKKSRS